ncbi:MAG: type II toxin-antitoxin system HicB family antitoxin [Deltaproteobacteria bacterium]|nr:type II toxin-antitoxin system HicB family antitoxin [Deltaproteobacteria bacterium]
MAKYLVNYERDETGWWIAKLKGVPGVNSDGRTVAEARRRVREALSLAIGDDQAKTAELVDHVKLPTQAQKIVDRATATRAKLDEIQAEAQISTAKAVRELRKQLGLSTRDIADLLCISHQRVQQLSRVRYSKMAYMK